MKKPNKTQKNQKHFKFTGFGQSIIVLLIAITLLNNFRVSESTRNRDNISATWDIVTKNVDNFSDVKDKDLFISTTYNDAYEINVADFYQRTGIRLAAFVWPGYIWENFDSCTNYEICPLDDAVIKINNWLTNISKGESYLRILMKKWKFNNDWPQTLQTEGALTRSNFWYFNIYMITEQVGLAYLIPIVKSDLNLSANIGKSKIFLVSLNSPTQIKPTLNGICLRADSEIQQFRTYKQIGYLQRWTIPSSYDAIENTDIRAVATGTC